ncbi:MAG: hypothetical protein Q9227_006631 [Pyrenula ochraceoflavens]
MAECQRSVLSCKRCRVRKIKCDRVLPSCGACVAAKATCTGFSSHHGAQKEIPRSVVQHLESEIARLEKQLAQDGHLDDLNASDILAGMPTREEGDTASSLKQRSTRLDETPFHDALKENIMGCDEVQAVISATLPIGCGLTDLVSKVRMGLTPSVLAPDGRSPIASRASFSKLNDTVVKANILRNMPSSIVNNLVQKYLARILPIYPAVYEPTVWKQLESVKKTLSTAENAVIAPSYDFLIIYLVMAISVTLGCSKSEDESRCMAFSGALFEEGIRHLNIRSHVPSDLAGLQATLLILQYATINPRFANVWILSGAAMRSCLELGLHRDPPNASELDPLSLDLRRRVFWCAYGMDRCVCAALQRPLSIPDPAISVELPSVLDDKHICATGIDATGTETKYHALRWIKFRCLQSSMIEVHFQNKPLDPDQTWNNWLQSMEAKIETWYTGYSGGHELAEYARAHALAALHRPSPRVPYPAPQSLQIAFQASYDSARSLHQHIRSGFYRRPWLLAHHTLEAAIIVLFCLRHGAGLIAQQFNASQIFDMTKLFTTNFLAISSQGWTEVSKIAETYERLLGPLLEFTLSGKPAVQHGFGPAQDAELLRLLYPGPAQLDKLRFGKSANDDMPASSMALLNSDDWTLGDGAPNLEVLDDWGLLDYTTIGPEDPILLEGF